MAFQYYTWFVMLNIWNVLCGFWLFLSPSLPSLTIFDILWWIPLPELPNFPNKPGHAVFGGKRQISPVTPLLTRINGRRSRERCCGKACGAGQHSDTLCTSCWTHKATSSRTKSKGWFCQKVTAQRRSWLIHWAFPPKASMVAVPQMKTDNPIWVEKPQCKENPSQLILPIHDHLQVE